MKRPDECPVCGWPYAFPELPVGEAYKKCMEIHKNTVSGKVTK